MVQKVNVTLDDVSPLINYSPPEAWGAGSTTKDPYGQFYDHNGTFTLTTQFGASASMTFNGTGVWIYGAKRDNHGPYNTTLDGRTSSDTGYSSINLLQRVLFSGTGLASGNHTVSIVNSLVDNSKPYLDIDSIVYEVEVPDGYGKFTEDDTADAFQFSPSAWSIYPEDLSNYSNGTGHVTSAPDARVVYTFEVGVYLIGSLIYGAVGPMNGVYTVQVDNGDSFTFNGIKDNLIPKTLLYQNNNLAPGRHTVNISNSPFAGQTLSIDYAVIYRSPSTGWVHLRDP
ncbi:hypothetical protein BDM02DRAFT_3087395 [Thelephora ganbajun]|uniref:Uncharacterized protein n=1 Tax=Thelephora ganbajun TaxID=370292 RepID=A0ACB6ZUQ6_THEGA|nr:hypothetical protein BDM02DRAFT_3087395 [Thelephora ganbajun]